MSSKRLKGKVLKEINKKLLISRVIEKVAQSNCVSKIIVATSKNKDDDLLVKFCKREKIEFFRGDLNNVYLRFVQVIKKLKAKAFIRITGDSPFIDPYIIDKGFNLYKSKKFEIITNSFPKTFPKGQSISIFNSRVFINTYKKIRKKEHREHITPYFFENYKSFKIKNFRCTKKLFHINMSIDNNEDMMRARKLAKKFDKLNGKKNLFNQMIKYLNK